jgi:hypothetical protein
MAVSYTMADFERDYIKEHLHKLTPQEQEDVVQALPPEARLRGPAAGGAAGRPAPVRAHMPPGSWPDQVRRAIRPVCR